VTAGVDSLAVNFAWDTTQVPDGYHQLTAVAYEGTSVATQTHVTQNVRIQNTGLTATLVSLPAGPNATLAQQLQFTVAANTTNVSSIKLFGTGGCLGVVSNQAAATFGASAAYLGLGPHPFYALVTDSSGNRYQTATVSYVVAPAMTLTLAGTPLALTASVAPNQRYALQFATNLLTGFRTVASVVATNALVQWPLVTTGAAGFYRVAWNP
jgi:hypothetical protein